MGIFDKESKLTGHFYCGSFNKKRKICGNDDFEYRIFKEKNYLKAEKEIIEILGKKDKYDVFDACRFFIEKYYAVQIPAKYDIAYRDTSEVVFGIFGEEKFTGSSTQYYDTDYVCTDDKSKDGEESIILLVDLYNNKMLHEKYPVVKQIYDELIQQKKQWIQAGEHPYYQFNTLISISTFDRKTINSMNVIESVSLIEDINYEIWYFYNHS